MWPQESKLIPYALRIDYLTCVTGLALALSSETHLHSRQAVAETRNE